MTTPTIEIPGYVTGTWDIDPVHSDISITARHFAVSKVRGHFKTFSGEVHTAENFLDSSVVANIEAASIDTNQDDRDNHIRSADFLDVENHPTITYRSTALKQSEDGFVIEGELTLHGVTKPVSLDAEISGFGKDPYGGTRLGVSATTTVLRSDFEMKFNAVVEAGRAVVSDKLQVALEIEAVLRAA
ncbi:MAG TPA: YceI family protein [Pseudonocardiaceae bacterium]